MWVFGTWKLHLVPDPLQKLYSIFLYSNNYKYYAETYHVVCSTSFSYLCTYGYNNFCIPSILCGEFLYLQLLPVYFFMFFNTNVVFPTSVLLKLHFVFCFYSVLGFAKWLRQRLKTKAFLLKTQTESCLPF